MPASPVSARSTPVASGAPVGPGSVGPRSVDPGSLLDAVIAAIPGGEDRPQQREMTRAVHAAFSSKRHLAVQGPTGVGKSIAYLLPAILAAQRGERTVIVTSSKALQDQLASVELPFLQATLDVPFSYAVLKGRSNYICEAAATEVRVQLRGGDQQGLDLGLPASAGEADLSDSDLRAEVDLILEWAESTSTGDMSELPASPHWKAWSTVSVGPGECVGASKCDHSADCWSEQARARAEDADIVVVNAHLYGAHIQTGRTLLPPHTQVIIDEAHEFEDSIVGSLSIELTEGRLLNLARVHDRCVAGDEKVSKSLRAAGDMLEACLEGVAGTAPVGGAAATPGDTSSAAVRSGFGTVRLTEGLSSDLASAVSTAAASADRALNSLRTAARSAGESTAKHRIERAVRTAESVVNDTQALLGKLGAGTVLWVEPTRGYRHAVRLTRIDVAATLRNRAWDDEDLTVVCCSATLDQGTARRLGLDAEFLSVASPFNFRDNAVLYVPKVHKPSHPEWPGQVADEIEHLIRACNGRTLALFTSTRMLRATVEICRERLADEFTILAQGDAPNPVLQEQFVSDEHSCLFATASFWTGMSSPGTTCSAVILDKIPFPVPSDPIVEARCDLVGDAAFMEVSVPAAGMQLAQGVGRLIRTASDRGVVAVCDPRLAESRYRNRMLDLLPPMRRVRNRDFVDRFIAGLELDGPVETVANPGDIVDGTAEIAVA